mgnify:FL=1|tara:strand:+ start:12302 stop:12781 length:480 start_codon:yes stop_codon:yes gene_type:complete
MTIFFIFQFLIFVFVHIVLNKFKFYGTLNPIFIFILSILIFFILSLLFNLFKIEKNYFLYLILHITIVMFYFHLFIGILKSVSVRILIEIIKSKKNYLTMLELNSIYSYSDLVENRIKLLLRKKWIIDNNNILSCTNKGRLLVKINLFFLKLYKIKNSG